MKKIDAHAHIGDFGSWAGVDGSPEQLIAFMDEYEIEQTVLCAKDHTGNEGVAEAAARYPGRFIPLVYLNPLEGADICREKVETYVDGKGFLCSFTPAILRIRCRGASRCSRSVSPRSRP